LTYLSLFLVQDVIKRPPIPTADFNSKKRKAWNVKFCVGNEGFFNL